MTLRYDGKVWVGGEAAMTHDAIVRVLGYLRP